ncbi:MAG: peptidase [Caulobacter sp.]|nr:peptidase [Caulobacter sp.]
MTRIALMAGIAVATVSGAAAPALADEGMWTFDNLPTARIEADYGVKLDAKWLDHVRLSAVRISGCSASFVSKDGLILTNNHCVVGCSSALSSSTTDYVKNGFRANLREEELKCPGQTAEVLLSITDVTGEIRAAGAGKTGEDFVKARDAASSAAEKTVCGAEAGVRCQAISLYRGGQYKVYKFQRYTDVRLVFAPEFDIAFFGGDPDNFNFPRYDMDSAFLRAYGADGKPVQTKNFLKWNASAPKEGDLTFVVGNPGSTERLLTVAQMETQRDLTIPIGQLQRSELRGRYLEYAKGGDEQKRTAGDALFGLENGFKVFYGRQLTLNDKGFMDAKRAAEAELRAKVKADPALSAKLGDPWADVEQAQVAYRDNWLEYRQLETEAGGGARLYNWAQTLVRASREKAKPVADRSADYSDAALARMERGLMAGTPVIAGIDQLKLEHWMLKTREYLTVDHPGVKKILGKESPQNLSARLVAGSKLGDPAVRKALWDGGMAAIEASDDPMIKFVLATEGQGRALKKVWESQVTAPVDSAAERIAQARFAVYGESVYPDATFSLRLSYGKVQGWTYRGTTVPAFTRIGGTWDRATGEAPFALPKSWLDKKSALNPETVFDYTTTNDIIGGNSGSPVIDAKGQVIGAAFDGNIHSLGGAYGYDGTLNRTVVVSTAAITEALVKVYGQTNLVKELTGK